ncbi:hypothetical protein V6N12_061852 [Hibiscus sabdariffa]|uniref:RRM domain-containing protein n=1 Tax=Hibiscus sabdariffa TaxID=183260 RepID=A0ABR2DYA4_9ROSI
MPHSRHKAEPHNIHGKRALTIWNKYLRKKIPLSCSLAISFLGCHIAREAVLPTDLIKWSVEGELTYFDAFVEIEKRIGQSLPPFPLSLRSMFRPAHAYSAQQLESLAATVAQCIGLNLPHVNFYGIASRYLKELSIPVEKILPHSCRIYMWVMPPELRLSANYSGLPTRVHVMSVLIVAIRILYDINGLGVWEKSLSSHNLPSRSTEALSKDHASSPKERDGAENGFGSHSADDLGTSSTRNPLSDHESKFDAAELLCNLEARYNEIYKAYGGVKCTRDLSKSMPSYLQFCQDVVFAGSEPAVDFFHEEKTLIDKLWNYYQEEKVSQPAEGLGEPHSSADIQYKAKKLVRDNEYHSSPSHDGRTSHEDISTQRHSDVDNSSMTSEENENPEPSDKVSAETNEHRAIRLMKKNMEENRLCYIPPRVKLRRLDYLQYARKRDEGAITYVAHADYYILLRACAMVAEVDMRILHGGKGESRKEDRAKIKHATSQHFFNFNSPLIPSQSHYKSLLPILSLSFPSTFSPFSISFSHPLRSLQMADASKVIHVRNVGHEISENDLLQLFQPFGVITKLVMLRAKNQALLQMQDVPSAINAMQFYTNVQPTIRGRNVYVQFSSHQELTTMDQNAQGRGDEPNRILLVTIHHMLYPITVEVLHQVFSPHGFVEKIVTFQKSAGFQALIQYQGHQNAISARTSLQGRNIYDGCCQLDIQFSNLDELQVHYNNDRSRDFTNPNLPTEQKGRSSQHPGYGDAGVGFPQMANAAAIAAAFGGGLPPGITGTNDRCTVLASSLNPDRIDEDKLFNLFSLYGNIVRIKLLRNKPDHALIQMGDGFQAELAVHFLKGAVLFGKRLEVNYSKYPNITQGADTHEYVNSNLNRFNRNAAKNYRYCCSPTKMIHLSTLPQDVTEEEIVNHLEEHGTITNTKLFEMNGKKQALVMFETEEQATEALVCKHATSLGQAIWSILFVSVRHIRTLLPSD